MMYVFYRNLCSILVLFMLFMAFTMPATAAPSTGLEGGQRHSYGPGVESKQEKRLMSGGIVDAYGNPVLPEEEKRAPRERLRSGAYGGHKETSPELSRPLPDLPAGDSLWQF